jgi:hypothetical protein
MEIFQVLDILEKIIKISREFNKNFRVRIYFLLKLIKDRKI